MPVSCCLLRAGLEPFENWSLRPRRSYLQLADGKNQWVLMQCPRWASVVVCISPAFYPLLQFLLP